MTSVTRPRGPLPPRVYWTRRLLVLGLACALVFGVGRLLEGVPGDQPAPRAQPAASEASDRPGGTSSAPAGSPTPDTHQPGGTGKAAEERARKKARPTETPLPMPSGPCRDSDVRVLPAMEGESYAGGTVLLTVELRTHETAACTWEVSRDSIAVKITSGRDRIWTSQECAAAVPTKPLVLRKETPATVDVPWSGRRSDPDCSRTTQWALPGYYHLSTAAMGADAETQQFRLREPVPATITPSPKPKPKKKKRQRAGG